MNAREHRQLIRSLQQQIKKLEFSRDKLHEEHNFVNALMDTTNSLILVIDSDGAIVQCNHAVEQFTGCTLEELKGRPFFWEQFILPAHLAGSRKIFTSFLEKVVIVRSKNCWITQNGSEHLFYWSNRIFVDQETGNRYLMTIGTDITEQRSMEKALQESLHEYATLISLIPSGVYKYRMQPDGNWLFEFVTTPFCDSLGLDVGDIYQNAQVVFQKIHNDDRDHFIALNNTAYATLTKLTWEGRIYKTAKEIRWIHIESLPTVLENGDILWIGVQYDITERKEYEEKLKHIAHYDTLTGIPNRHFFANMLNQALARTKRHKTLLAVCYLDLDAFKPVNDQFGHAAGDQLLIEITNRLKNTIRAEDTLARLGGDEFTLILNDLNNSQECDIVLQRILATVSSPVAIDDATVNISVSIGVTFYPLDDSSADTLLLHADQAMYQAKESGKNRYHFFSGNI